MSSTSKFLKRNYLPTLHYSCFIFFLSDHFSLLVYYFSFVYNIFFSLLADIELLFVLFISYIHVHWLGILICSHITEYHLSKRGSEYLSPVCVLASLTFTLAISDHLGMLHGLLGFCFHIYFFSTFRLKPDLLFFHLFLRVYHSLMYTHTCAQTHTCTHTRTHSWTHKHSWIGPFLPT